MSGPQHTGLNRPRRNDSVSSSPCSEDSSLADTSSDFPSLLDPSLVKPSAPLPAFTLSVPSVPSCADVGPTAPVPVRPGPPFQQEAEANFKPKTVKFWLIIISNFVALFLVALDRTILSTAIPSITDEFGSLGDIGWYGSAYMLTTAAFQLLFGRVYHFYELKSILISSVVIFEVGSTICGAAPSSSVFILGRAIAGLGSAGVFTGGMLVIMPMVPLHKRPIFQSMFGIIFGVASVTGPLIGGAFTEKATWRWCFYMNVPIGAVSMMCLVILLKSPDVPRKTASVWKQITRLDPVGTCLFIPSVVCLLMALQWGGSVYPWANWRLIVLFVISGLSAIAFVVVQLKMPESASLPVRIVKQRSMWAGAIFVFFLAGSLMVCIFYIPLWFQTAKSVNPIKSGLYTLPLVLSMAVASIMSGALTQRSGYYLPSMILCPCFMSIGQGLLTTLTPTASSSQWITYQFLVGFGIGFGIQTAMLAVQTTLPPPDIPTGIAITFFSQQLGGAVFVAAGQTILNSLLGQRLGHIQDIDPSTIARSGATDLMKLVPERLYGEVSHAYNDACTRIFTMGAALSCAQVLFALAMEWRTIREGKQGPITPSTAVQRGPMSEEKGNK